MKTVQLPDNPSDRAHDSNSTSPGDQGQYSKFECHQLSADHIFYSGNLPQDIRFESSSFDALWNLHPEEYHEIVMHGRVVKTPRWQKALGADYHYTGRVNKADPVPPILQPIQQWCNAEIDSRLNGILLNYYDGKLSHYIGKHRDSTKNMIVGAPILTISLGEERGIRLRPWKGAGYRDFPATDGTVFVMPYETNLAWTHEVPHFARYQGRRISVTLRAFQTTDDV